MSRMCKSLELFVLNCLVLAIISHTGQIPPPRNVSLSWTNDFCANLTWAPPENLGASCLYYLEPLKVSKDFHILFYEYVQTREGGPLKFSVQTECGTNKSEPVVISHTYPELVRDFQCSIYSSNLSICSWFPHEHVLDLHLFHKSISIWEDPDCSNLSKSRVLNLIECSVYKDGVKTGCRLQGSYFQTNIYFVFRGRLNDTPVINTFQKPMQSEQIRPPPIHFTLTRVWDQLNVNWTPPDIGKLHYWTYRINYTECGTQKSLNVDGPHSHVLNINPDCQHNISIKADFDGGKGFTPWSDFQLSSPPPLYALYATIIIPVAFAALAVLALVCFRKHKEKIFPKVPEPRDLLRDILNNNNLSTPGNLYIPAQEEECKITLVIDPQENCCRDKKLNL